MLRSFEAGFTINGSIHSDLLDSVQANIAQDKREYQENTFCFIPCHMIVAGYYRFTLEVRVSICQLYVRPSVFRFPDDNFSKHQWIFTKLGMCIDIVETRFRMLMGKFCRIFTELYAHGTIMVGYYSFKFFISARKLAL